LYSLGIKNFPDRLPPSLHCLQPDPWVGFIVKVELITNPEHPPPTTLTLRKYDGSLEMPAFVINVCTFAFAFSLTKMALSIVKLMYLYLASGF
jgi:hypothetical protein